MSAFRIEPLTATPQTLAELATLLVDTVARGGSVSFMHPLPLADAEAFWQRSLDAAGRGERVVLGAFDGSALAGTLTLLLDAPPNQPHRGELAKMMTRHSHRGRGIATALLVEAERLALQQGRWLLTLDTASEGGAAPLYRKLGYTYAGTLPDYALKPQGGLVGTELYWKRLQ